MKKRISKFVRKNDTVRTYYSKTFCVEYATMIVFTLATKQLWEACSAIKRICLSIETLFSVIEYIASIFQLKFFEQITRYLYNFREIFEKIFDSLGAVSACQFVLN